MGVERQHLNFEPISGAHQTKKNVSISIYMCICIYICIYVNISIIYI